MKLGQTKTPQEMHKELQDKCKYCLGYGELPIKNEIGQWILIPCPECNQPAPVIEEIQTVDDSIEYAEITVSPKDEEGKTRMELLLDMPEQLEKLGEILTFGINKYPTRMGWETRTVDQYRGAIMRHLLKWRKGERIDPETGLPHILHVAVNCMFIDYIENKNG